MNPAAVDLRRIADQSAALAALQPPRPPGVKAFEVGKRYTVDCLDDREYSGTLLGISENGSGTMCWLTLETSYQKTPVYIPWHAVARILPVFVEGE